MNRAVIIPLFGPIVGREMNGSAKNMCENPLVNEDVEYMEVNFGQSFVPSLFAPKISFQNTTICEHYQVLDIIIEPQFLCSNSSPGEAITYCNEWAS